MNSDLQSPIKNDRLPLRREALKDTKDDNPDNLMHLSKNSNITPNNTAPMLDKINVIPPEKSECINPSTFNLIEKPKKDMAKQKMEMKTKNKEHLNKNSNITSNNTAPM